MSIRHYLALTKPGIIFGNAITATSGFLLASPERIDGMRLLLMLLGLSLVIASASVFNNYLDRHIDAKMERTKARVLPRHLLFARHVLLFATVLGFLGSTVLLFSTNLLTLTLALAGLILYVTVYSLWKYCSSQGTVIGSLSGAMPPAVGYCAVSDLFDGGVGLLCLATAFWQMPHFLAIAIRHSEDYQRVAIPVLPVAKGMQRTKIEMLLYTIAFAITALLLPLFSYTGVLYLSIIALLGVVWIALSLQGFHTSDDRPWARKMFLFSLIAIMGVSLAIAADRLYMLNL